MWVILREPVESLGKVGDEVNVAVGYVRNYLLPQHKAMLATPTNRSAIAREKAKLDLKAAKDKSLAELAAEKIRGAVCTITAKVSEEDRLYGSVSARDIAEQLRAQGLEVDRKTIFLPDPIKKIGSYTVSVHLHPEVRPDITVNVVAEQGIE